ncbi:hypothetical protein LVJ94_25920 [Pendulispora rubella]|uniref:Uncharacterized protein n=1 Tax=Pendulispora rubella TaxID=2741070 RepID=A0ABZ2LIT9_9BACT
MTASFAACSSNDAEPDSPGGPDAGGDPSDSGASAPVPHLGVNYNGRPRSYIAGDVARTGAGWVRAFIDIFELQDAGEASMASNPDIVALGKAHDDGYKIIVSLKYDFSRPDRTTFPSDPNGQPFRDLVTFTTKLLDLVYPKVDLLVIGNEPFIEVPSGQRDSNDLVLFYEHMADQVLAYRTNHGRDIPFYVGAFNNLHEPAWHGPGAVALLGYAKNTAGIAGVDLHLHAGSVNEMRTAFDWAHAQLGDQKSFITTEFSLVQYFKKQLGETIDANFAKQYGIDPTWKVYQYLDFALKNPRPRDQWVDFLKASPWYVAAEPSLANAADLLHEKNFAVATYAIVQGQTSIGPTTAPWALNGLYCNRTCVPDPSTGASQFNYPWIDAFRTHQW